MNVRRSEPSGEERLTAHNVDLLTLLDRAKDTLLTKGEAPPGNQHRYSLWQSSRRSLCRSTWAALYGQHKSCWDRGGEGRKKTVMLLQNVEQDQPLVNKYTCDLKGEEVPRAVLDATLLGGRDGGLPSLGQTDRDPCSLSTLRVAISSPHKAKIKVGTRMGCRSKPSNSGPCIFVFH